MRILLVHQGFPGQFKYLAPIAARTGHEVVFITASTTQSLMGVRQVMYEIPAPFSGISDPLLGHLSDALRYGRAAREAAIKLRDTGFIPDVILVHPGWGEGFFLRDVFPRTKMMCFLEFFFSPEGNFFDFENPDPDLDTRAKLHMLNAPVLDALNESSWNIAPTRWQKHLFPEIFQPRITTIHEGVNLHRFVKCPGVQVEAPDGAVLKEGMEVVTFVARHLEPIRGFRTFMKAAALILQNRRNAHIAIAGGEEGGYAPPPPGGETHKQMILRELDIDLTRVHFFGRVGQSIVVKLMQISRVHLFLTYPFLISWSVLEALACSCIVVASDTGPVREIITDGENGRLVDFFDHCKFADVTCEVLDDPARFAILGEAAKQRVAVDFDAITNAKKQISLLNAVASGIELSPEEILRF